VEHARARQRQKRGGGVDRIALDEAAALAPGLDELDILVLDEALGRLAVEDDREARVVELRFFAGLNVEETATALGISTRTVEGDWAMAKAWLKRELSSQTSTG